MAGLAKTRATAHMFGTQLAAGHLIYPKAKMVCFGEFWTELDSSSLVGLGDVKVTKFSHMKLTNSYDTPTH